MRPLLFGNNSFGVSLYFVSFIILTSIVLVNVVVAVLLEKMVDDDSPPPPKELWAMAGAAQGLGLDSKAIEKAKTSKGGMEAIVQAAKQAAQEKDFKQMKRDVQLMKLQMDALMRHMGVPPVTLDGRAPSECPETSSAAGANGGGTSESNGGALGAQLGKLRAASKSHDKLDTCEA